jgi:oligopeptide/dipeptide ABC transporter ATP-binding protein
LDEAHLDRLPHQLSGGQRQRVGIARALAVRPKVIILDEPTASLDVSVRGRILDLLAQLQAQFDLAYLFITHDLQVARYLSDRVAVMYLGRILEEGSSDEVFGAPSHPYTKALLSAAPVAEWGRRRERYLLEGEIPSPIDLPSGCPLSGRCPRVVDSCHVAPPPLAILEGSHRSACPITAAS